MPTGASIDLSPPEFYELGLAGRAFFTGRGPLINPTGSAFRTLLVNPANSGRLAMVQRVRYFSSGVNEFLAVRLNPTGNLPTFGLPSSSYRIAAPAGLSQVFIDVGPAPTGGAELPYRVPAQPEDALVEFLIYPTRIMPPGTSVSLYTENTSGGDVQLTIIVDWFEVDFLP